MPVWKWLCTFQIRLRNIDEKYKINEWDDSAEKLFQLGRKEALDKDILEILPHLELPADPEELGDHVSKPIH